MQKDFITKQNRNLRDITLWIPFIFFVLCLLFPTRNSGIDAWFSAASVKWNGELFHPHHLLYNFIAHTGIRILKMTGINVDTLEAMKGFNAFYGLLILLVFRSILREIGNSIREITALLVFAGASFAILRFATENETYLLPVVFSLMSVLYAVRTVKTPDIRYAIYSGAFGALAILSHEVHLFWWAGLALFFFFSKRKLFLWYLLPGFIIPAVYFLVWLIFPQHIPPSGRFISFVLYDFQRGFISFIPGIKNLILFFISLIRSFFQIHGYMIYLFRENPDYLFAVIFSSFFLLLGFFQKGLTWKKTDQAYKWFGKSHLAVLSMQLLWAFYSVGNAEFMVMIPIVFSIYIASLYRFSAPAFLSWGIAMLIWNFVFGIYPLHHYKLNDPDFFITETGKYPNSLFILNDDQLVKAVYYYRNGKQDLPQVMKTPEHLMQAGKDTSSLSAVMQQYFDDDQPVFTDCVGNRNAIDRDAFMKEGVDKLFFRSFRIEPFDSVKLLSGYRKLYRVRLPER